MNIESHGNDFFLLLNFDFYSNYVKQYAKNPYLHITITKRSQILFRISNVSFLYSNKYSSS